MSVGHRQLPVTAHTTLDHVEAAVTGGDWDAEAIAVLDVESPDDRPYVELGFELDPIAVDRLVPHADRARLTPDQARELAGALEVAATAAENGESMTSGRR